MAKSSHEEHKDQLVAAAAVNQTGAQNAGPVLRGGSRLSEARSVVKAIKERDPKNKDKYNIKYLTLTEVPEELVSSGLLFDDSSVDNVALLNKCDAVIYIFESNDSEQVDFVKKAQEKFKETEHLRFVPTILF